MRASSNIAFKEWAVVVEALGLGEQVLVLRKGGIRERRGEFDVEHGEFWLFPTQYHEDETSVIPSKRPALREIAGRASKDFVEIQFYAVADPVIHMTDPSPLRNLQGHHIWNEHILQERFGFGREPGLFALVCRVYRLPAPERLPMRESYGGCKSWVELERPISTTRLAPVLSDAQFSAERDELCERLGAYATAHS